MDRNRITALLLAGALLGGTPGAFAGTPPENKPADPKAVLAAMARYSEPGESHKVLKALEGAWATTAKVWLAPGSPPDTATGRAEFWSHHGDRFLIEEFNGSLLGRPVTLHLIFGYDNAKKKYVATMISSVSTEIKTREGSADGTGKVITFTGSTFDAPSGRYHAERAVYRIESPKRLLVEVYETPPGGAEFKKMEVVYTRK